MQLLRRAKETGVRPCSSKYSLTFSVWSNLSIKASALLLKKISSSQNSILKVTMINSQIGWIYKCNQAKKICLLRTTQIKSQLSTLMKSPIQSTISFLWNPMKIVFFMHLKISTFSPDSSMLCLKELLEWRKWLRPKEKSTYSRYSILSVSRARKVQDFKTVWILCSEIMPICSLLFTSF